jgi:hypothetical protein
METENKELLNCIRTLAYYHNNYRYETHKDCLSFEFTDDINPDDLYECLTTYFIDITDESIGQAWRGLDLVGKDILIRSMNAFKMIQDIIIDDNLICFKYPFTFSKGDLYAMHELLKADNTTAFKNTFPDVTEEKILDEIDKLNLLMMHLDFLIDIRIR